jgi:hypothetical protein
MKMKENEEEEGEWRMKNQKNGEWRMRMENENAD